jgi:hypothetical protein
MTQPHYPQILFSGSVCLPLRTPFVIRSYDILIKGVQQGVVPSSDGGTRPQSRADDRLEAVPAPHHQPTPPSGARVHRGGALAPPLDESSAKAFRVGCEAVGPVRLATIHRAGTPHGAAPAGVALSCLTGVAVA